MRYVHFCLARAVLMAVVLSQTGCAIVSSSKLGTGDEAKANIGIPYMLPKAVVPYQVVTSGALIRVDLLEPVYVGDPSQLYVLSYQGSPLSSDTIKIGVDPATLLLKTLSLESKDETGEILKKSIATLRAESAAGTTETVIAQGILDPSNKKSVQTAKEVIGEAIAIHVAAQKSVCAQTPTLENCTEILSLRNSNVVDLAVSLMSQNSFSESSEPVAFYSTATAARVGVDCSVGICIRGTLPYEVSLSALGQRRATLVQLPNHGPVTALPLSRHAFVKTIHTVAFRNGMLENYEISKPSSALAIVSWPLAVYDEIVTTTAKIIQLKIDTSKNDVKLQEQLFVEAEKRKELDDKLKALLARPESATLISMGNTKTLLTLGTGKPPSVLPSRVLSDLGNANPSATNNGQTTLPKVNPTPSPAGVPMKPGNDGSEGK